MHLHYTLKRKIFIGIFPGLISGIIIYFFDEQAEAIFDTIDILAERMRRIGGTTIRSITHISSLQTITDNNDDFVSPAQMIA